MHCKLIVCIFILLSNINYSICQTNEQIEIRQAIKIRNLTRIYEVIDWLTISHKKDKTTIINALFSEYNNCSDLDDLEYLIKNKLITYKYAFQENENPFFLACKCGDASFIKTALLKKFPINFKTDHNRTPLMITAENGHLDLVKFLIEQGADWTILDKGQQSVLFYAANSNNLKLVKYLIRKGVDPDHRDISHQKAILFAIINENIPMVRFLLKKQKEKYVEEHDHYWFWAAASMASSKKLPEFIEKKFGVNMKKRDPFGNTVLHDATKFNDSLEVIQYLLDLGADINAQNNKGQTPIYNYAENFELVKFLVENGASLDIQDNDGNNFAKYIVNSMVKPIAFSSNQGLFRLPLEDDFYMEKLKIVKYLSEKGATIESQNALNYLLFKTIEYNNTILLDQLLKQKIVTLKEVNLQNESPLEYASKENRTEIILILKEYGLKN